jgi:hypothetical protein
MCTQIRTSRCWVNAHCAYINNFTGQLFTYFLPVYLNRECVDGFLCFAVLVCVCPESVCNQVLLHYPIQNDNNNLYESQWSLSLSVALDMYDLDGLCTDTLSGATTGTATVRSRFLTSSASIQSLGWRRQCSAQGRVVLSGKYNYETKRYATQLNTATTIQTQSRFLLRFYAGVFLLISHLRTCPRCVIAGSGRCCWPGRS